MCISDWSSDVCSSDLLRLGAEILGCFQLLGRWLEQRKLLLLLFALKPFKRLALTRGKARIANAHVGGFVGQADNNAIGAHVAEHALDFRVEQMEQFFKTLRRCTPAQRHRQRFLLQGADEAVSISERKSTRLNS